MRKIVGIDIGYGYTKIVTHDASGTIQTMLTESIVGTYENGYDVEGLKSADKTIVKVDGEKYLIGKAATKHSSRILNGREKTWIASTAYRALLTYALESAGCNVAESQVITGLPVSYYKSDREKLHDLVLSVSGEYSPNVTVKVLPQPLGSFFNLLFEGDGAVRDRKLADQKIGVLDIGYYTSDLLTLEGMELVERQLASFENGVSTAFDGVQKTLVEKLNNEYALAAIETACRTGSIRYKGENISITNTADRHLNALADEITARARTIWKQAADIDRIILTGGGSALLNGRLKLYEHATICDDSQLANAMGYYKFGRRSANA